MRPRLLSLVAFSLTASAMTVLPPAIAGDLYKWTDAKGQIHYSSTPPPETAKKAVTIDSGKLSNVNALPNDLHKTRAEGSGPTDSSGSSSWTPTETTSNDNSAPASPPVLIPPSLLAPSNPPATAKPEQTAQPEIVEVVAQGMGIDANSALLNAYSNAVQQALGLYVDAETMVQNDQIVQDKILTYSKGFIQEATTVKQSQANGLFQVNIRAKVKRQQLLKQAKANNITVKAVEGVSLHAQVETQIKQEKDAKKLLEKVLLPLANTTFLHRAELVPPTPEQPNPIINKEGTDDNFVTLDYKVYLWIDEQEYDKYVKNSLIPVLDQIAIRKQDATKNYGVYSDGFKHEADASYDERYDNRNEVAISVLKWKDKAFTVGKFGIYIISKDHLTKSLDEYDADDNKKLGLTIELSLLGENGDTIALGNGANNMKKYLNSWGCSVLTYKSGRSWISIKPYFSDFGGRRLLLPKSSYLTIPIKIAKQDLPRVKTAKIQINTTGR